ncbi:MAG TPA: RsmE family RNA methyltransferase, partial [Thermoanaerobaculia bacterium]|nr:RsmE family RNA methyltransferase [Thermoanaerobaculia bacterium]
MTGRKTVDREPAAARPPRVIVPDLAAHAGSSGEIPLGKDEIAHLLSRRLRDGDDVVVLDGRGARGRARVAGRGTAVVLASFEGFPGASPAPSPFPSLPGEPARRVTVLLSCAETARIEWAVEKGTECGAAGFVLLAAARSQRSHVAALGARRARLSRIAAEAAKQCDRTIVPEIEGPVTPGEILRTWTGPLLLAQPGAPAFASSAVAAWGGVALAA